MQAINNFCRELGVTRTENLQVAYHKLEHYIRQDLDSSCPRALAVLDPLRVVLTNCADDFHEDQYARVSSTGSAFLGGTLQQPAGYTCTHEVCTHNSVPVDPCNDEHHASGGMQQAGLHET